MKKIALVVVSSLFVAGSALACPGMDHETKTAKKEEAPKKDAAPKKEETPAPKAPEKTEAPKTAKPDKIEKPADKTGEKKPDKVSSR